MDSYWINSLYLQLPKSLVNRISPKRGLSAHINVCQVNLLFINFKNLLNKSQNQAFETLFSTKNELATAL